MNKKWLKAAGIRALKTFAQASIAAIGTAAAMGEVNWLGVLSIAGLAAVLSVLMSVAGLPEVPEEEGREG
jgi:Ni,Fe-hydrogenase III small subunit